MNEPLYWNKLSDAASWLTEQVAKPITEKWLLDAAVSADWINATGDEETSLSFLLPQDAEALAIKRYSIEQWEGLWPWEQEFHLEMLDKYGELPDFKYYIENRFTGVMPLSVYDVQQLFLYGQVSISQVCIRHITNEQTGVFIMPLNQPRMITVESVGIYGATLIAWAERLKAPPSYKAAASETEPNNTGTEKKWTDEYIAQVRARYNELKESGIKDFAAKTALEYKVSASLIRKKLNEQDERLAKPQSSPAFSALEKK